MQSVFAVEDSHQSIQELELAAFFQGSKVDDDL